MRATLQFYHIVYWTLLISTLACGAMLMVIAEVIDHDQIHEMRLLYAILMTLFSALAVGGPVAHSYAEEFHRRQQAKEDMQRELDPLTGKAHVDGADGDDSHFTEVPLDHSEFSSE